MIILVITKVLGFLKIRLIAQLFGATRELDLFWAAFAIPDTLFNILIAGSINAAVIPVFSDLLNKKGDTGLLKLFAKLNFLVSLLIIAISIVAFIFANDIGMLLVGKGWGVEFLQTSADITVNDISLLTTLIRIMLLSPIFLGISSLLSAYLQVYKQFFITSLAPLAYNLVMIIASLILVKYNDWGVQGIAWATVLGSAAHLASQIPALLKHLKFKSFEEALGFEMIVLKSKQEMKEILRIIRLAGPRVIGLVGEQINAFINTVISFTLSAGALSAYKFAYSLHLFPVQIVGGAISLVALPHLSDSYSKGDTKDFVKIYNDALQKAMFLILPILSVIFVLRLPIVRLAYGTGQFDWWATIITSWCLFLLAFAVLGQVLSSLTLRAFYALHETRKPLYVMIFVVILNILGSYYLTNFFSHYLDWRPIVGQIFLQIEGNSTAGDFSTTILSFMRDMKVWLTTRNVYDSAVGGLALSLSLSFMVEALLYMYILNRRIKVFSWEFTYKPLMQKIISSLVMLVIMYLAFRLTDFNLDTTRTINVLLITIITSVLGGSVYLLMSKIFKVEELSIVDGYYKMWLNLRNKAFIYIRNFFAPERTKDEKK